MIKICNYSPNFSTPKRPKKSIKFIVIHYTGMKKELDAIQRLQNPKFKVSSHYLIKKNGEIVILVPDLYEAWHAGLSSWKNHKYFNKNSIGIEISNPGHQHGYKNFSKNQILSLKKLLMYLIKKFQIKKKNILGHSDISPNRKKDPGEKFPWKHLSKYKIGLWHNFNQKLIIKKRNVNIEKKEKIKFFKNLFKIGYPKIKFIYDTKYTKLIVKAFQRRYRQELINGVVDLECLLISYKIARKK